MRNAVRLRFNFSVQYLYRPDNLFDNIRRFLNPCSLPFRLLLHIGHLRGYLVHSSCGLPHIHSKVLSDALHKLGIMPGSLNCVPYFLDCPVKIISDPRNFRRSRNRQPHR